MGFLSAISASVTGGMVGFPWDYSYYHLNHLAFVFYLSSHHLRISNSCDKWSESWINTSLFVLLCAITTLGDELSGTAKHAGMHDLLRISSVTSVVAIRKYKLITYVRNLGKRN